MRTTVHQNTTTKQSNGSTSAVWNRQEVDTKQEHKDALQLGKPLTQLTAAGSADDKPTQPAPIGFDFSKIPIVPSSPAGIQRKLKINSPGDRYEQEADRVAEQVMRMPAPQVQRMPLWSPTLPHVISIQRMGEAFAKEEEETLQAKSTGNTGGTVPPAIAQQIQSSRGGGQPMDKSTRSFMEARFGTDFGGVRIHADNNSALFNQRLQAKAFTLGGDVYFNQGQYRPGEGDGRRLLAHELTHVVQQGANGKSSQNYLVIQKKGETASVLTNYDVSDDLYVSPNWVSVNEMGIVYQETGANIRNKPLPQADGSVTIKHLKQNEKIFILRHDPKENWYAVTTDDGVLGYVADWLIWKNLPELNVEILKIPSGSTAIDIARKFYGESFNKWGSDQRFVVNALAYANNRDDHNGVGKPGIFKPEGNDQSWAKTQVSKDVYIWLPSVSFLNSLHGKVSSGSISYEAWEGVKAVGSALAFGAAFIGGILHGAFDGLIALVTGIIDLIWGALKSIFTGSVWDDLKKMWGAVTSMGWEDWKDLFFGWMDPWLEKGKSDDSFVSGHAYGYIAGRILFEIVIMFVGGTAIAKIVSQLGKLGSKLSKLGVIQKLGSGVSKATGKVKEGIEKLRSLVKAKRATKTSSQILSWGKNATGHLIKHADALGFGGYTPQQLQKMLPQLRSAANQLYNNLNPALTRIGRWGGQTDDVLMHITNNGKMLVTKQNGEFITIINKTSNNWYQLAKPLK